MAQPTLGEIAAHREDLAVVEEIIALINAIPEPEVPVSQTELQRDKRKYEKKSPKWGLNPPAPAGD